jgi:hypothetical protein
MIEGDLVKFQKFQEEYKKYPKKIMSVVEKIMVSYGGPEKALENLKKPQVMSRTPNFFKNLLGKYLAEAMPEIERIADSKTLAVLQKLLYNLDNTKKIQGGRRRRSKTLRKNQQFVGGGKALTTLIIFLVTICYMASALNQSTYMYNDIFDTMPERYRGNMTTSGLYDGLGEIIKNGNTYTMNFENENSGVGIVKYHTGDSFAGRIQNLKPNGYGEFVKDGIHYKGMFDEESKGLGSFETPEYSYIGEFKDFQPNGYGQKTIKKTGKVFVGTFQDGVLKGYGSIKDGNIVTKGKFDDKGENFQTYNFLSRQPSEDQKNADITIAEANEKLNQVNELMPDVSQEVKEANQIPHEFQKQEKTKENQEKTDRERYASYLKKLRLDQERLRLDQERKDKNMKYAAAGFVAISMLILFFNMQAKKDKSLALPTSPSSSSNASPPPPQVSSSSIPVSSSTQQVSSSPIPVSSSTQQVSSSTQQVSSSPQQVSPSNQQVSPSSSSNASPPPPPVLPPPPPVLPPPTPDSSLTLTNAQTSQVLPPPPPTPSDPDYLAIVLIACKKLFFDGKQVMYNSSEGWFGGESYIEYSYEAFLKDVTKKEGDRILEALHLLSKCKTEGKQFALFEEHPFLKELENKTDDEEIVHAFLDKLSQTKGQMTAQTTAQTKGGAHQIIKKSPLQKRNAKTTQKNKLRSRARSRTRA